jgi:hypothetical protein
MYRSHFQVLGSPFVFWVRFGVLGSEFGVRRFELEHGTEPEHESRTENPEA